MIVHFDHHGEHCKFDTESRLIRRQHSTVPLMAAHPDLRNAAVSAKVALLRQRAREQFNPLSLQELENTNHDTQSTSLPSEQALRAGF